MPTKDMTGDCEGTVQGEASAPAPECNSVDRHVAERLRQRRSMLGLSLLRLAERIGLPLRCLQRYEAGESRISAGRLQQIADVLGVHVAYFFDEMPNLEP
jgi:ribosome-binding protein aMBF1 (putative translation factor)